MDFIRAMSEGAKEELAALTHALYRGDITLPQWETAATSIIKDAHIANGTFGAGGKDVIGSAGYGRIGGNLADEYRFLNNFAEAIKAGEVSEAQAVARIQQYGSASQQAYWREFGDRADRPAWDGLPALNQVPRDGGTKCKGHCNCEITEHSDGLHWDLKPGESCEDCEALNAGGPYRPGKL